MWRAVLVGVNSYEDSAFESLKYAIKDIEDVGSLLSNPEIGEFLPANITTLKDAAHTQVNETLDRELSAASNKDSLLIYFAGHGKADRNGRLCLAVKSTKTEALISTSLHLETVKAMVQNSPAQRIVLILDCCFGGAAGESLRGSALLGDSFEAMSGMGKIIISSCGEFQRARERDELGHGVFTHCLLEGLKTGDADADKDGKIGIDELFSFVQTLMKKLAADQTPHKWGDDQTGDIYIAKSIRSIREREAKQKDFDDKKIRLATWYFEGSISAEIYSRALPLLGLEPKAASGKDQRLVRLLYDTLEGRMDLAVFIQSWTFIEKPNAKDEARVAFAQAQQKDSEDCWREYLTSFQGVIKENDRIAQDRLDQCKRQREEQEHREYEAYQRAEEQNTTEVWHGFLRDYPQSARKPEVLSRLVSVGGQDRTDTANKAVERARQTDTLDAWESYLEKWSGVSRQHDIEAKTRLQALRAEQAETRAYETARQQGRTEDLVKFLLAFPDSPHGDEVLKLLSALPAPVPWPSGGWLRRAGADSIDWLVIALVLTTSIYLTISPSSWIGFLIALIITVLVTSLAYGFWIFKTGKTFGNTVMQTRIVDQRGNTPTYLRALGYVGAWLLWWGFWFCLGAAAGSALESVTTKSLGPPLASFLFVAVVAPTVITAVAVHTTFRHVAPYDLLAGTTVVIEPRREAPPLMNVLTPGSLRRLTADFVDAASLIVAGASLAALTGLLRDASKAGAPNGAIGKLSILAQSLVEREALLLFAFVWLCYYVLFFSRFGQTLGSSIMGFRFLRADRGVPDWWNAIRYAGGLLIAYVSAVYLWKPQWWMINLRWFLILPLVAFLVNPLLVRLRKRSLYDFIAGTQALRLG